MENFLSPTYVELYTRLIVALLLGMLIGTERLIAHKTAGMRTFSLVSMGASLFVIIATLIAQQYAPASFNGAYIPAAIITGVGFIGSGLMTWKHSQLLRYICCRIVDFCWYWYCMWFWFVSNCHCCVRARIVYFHCSLVY